MGPLQNVIGMMPGMPKEVEERRDRRRRARRGRGDHPVDDARGAAQARSSSTARGGTRIAKGSGVPPSDVNNLLKQFKQVQQMMKGLGGEMGKKGKKGKRPKHADLPAFQGSDYTGTRRRGLPWSPAPRSLDSLAPTGSTEEFSCGRQDPPDARRQEEAADVPRRRRRRAQPARRPVHRDHRAVRAAPGTVGRQDRHRPGRHWLQKGAQPTEQAAKLLEIAGVWDAYKSATGKDAAAKPKPKTPKAKTVKAEQEAPRRPPRRAAAERRGARATKHRPRPQTDE